MNTRTLISLLLSSMLLLPGCVGDLGADRVADPNAKAGGAGGSSGSDPENDPATKNCWKTPGTKLFGTARDGAAPRGRRR